MAGTHRDSQLEKFIGLVSSQPPFNQLANNERSLLFRNTKILTCEIGQRILRPDKISDRIFFLLSGKIRLLAEDSTSSRTLDVRGPGQMIGWVSLLRGSPCEWVIASEKCTLMAIPSVDFITAYRNSVALRSSFSEMQNPHELNVVVASIMESASLRKEGWADRLKADVKSYFSASVAPGEIFSPKHDSTEDLVWLMSSDNVPDIPVGERIVRGHQMPNSEHNHLPYRLIGIPPHPDLLIDQPPQKNYKPFEEQPSLSLQDLGILEEDHISDDDRFPIVQGNGELNEALAVTEMVALHQLVPFRRDVILKVLESQFRRDKGVTIELMGGLLEILGMNCQLAEVDTQYLLSVEAPAVVMLEGVPVVFFSRKGNRFIVGHPHHGLQSLSFKFLQEKIPERMRFILPRRISSTPLSRFGWNWFTPLITKYKKSLSLVFVPVKKPRIVFSSPNLCDNSPTGRFSKKANGNDNSRPITAVPKVRSIRSVVSTKIYVLRTVKTP